MKRINKKYNDARMLQGFSNKYFKNVTQGTLDLKCLKNFSKVTQQAFE